MLISNICTYDKQTPESSQKCNSKLTFEILSDKDDDTEVSIEAITDEEGGEDQEPGDWGRQQISLNLENQQHREDSQTKMFSVFSPLNAWNVSGVF